MGVGQGEGEETDEGEEATTATMTAQFLVLAPLGQRSLTAKARATLPLTLRCRGRRCCGGAMFGRWGFPPLLRRGGPCATIHRSSLQGFLSSGSSTQLQEVVASQRPWPLLPSQPWPSQPWPPAALATLAGPRCCGGSQGRGARSCGCSSDSHFPMSSLALLNLSPSRPLPDTHFLMSSLVLPSLFVALSLFPPALPALRPPSPF